MLSTELPCPQLTPSSSSSSSSGSSRGWQYCAQLWIQSWCLSLFLVHLLHPGKNEGKLAASHLANARAASKHGATGRTPVFVQSSCRTHSNWHTTTDCCGCCSALGWLKQLLLSALIVCQCPAPTCTLCSLCCCYPAGWATTQLTSMWATTGGCRRRQMRCRTHHSLTHTTRCVHGSSRAAAVVVSSKCLQAAHGEAAACWWVPQCRRTAFGAFEAVTKPVAHCGSSAG